MPSKRKEQINLNLTALNLHDGGAHNKWLTNANVRIATEPLKVDEAKIMWYWAIVYLFQFVARRLPTPTIVYAHGSRAKIDENTVG